MTQSSSSAPAPASVPDPISADLRQKITAGHIVPLWESRSTAFGREPEKAFHWPWTTIEPIIREAATIKAPTILERRVMMMVNPTIPYNEAECCAGLVSAGIQALIPGEVARPHRHSMHALRFILEGEGAETIVEGKHCAMLPGDLVVTPGWTWHEHHNTQGKPTIWVDILDVAIHRALHTDAFQPGPTQGLTTPPADTSFEIAGFVPLTEGAYSSYTPVFRYSAEDALEAVSAAPLNDSGVRIVRYTNPTDGGPVLPSIDCYLQQIDEGVVTRLQTSSAGEVCVVVEGTGESTIGDVTVKWGPKDVFTIPRGRPVSHHAKTGPARIFIASDREIYRRVGAIAIDGAAPVV